MHSYTLVYTLPPRLVCWNVQCCFVLLLRYALWWTLTTSLHIYIIWRQNTSFICLRYNARMTLFLFIIFIAQESKLILNERSEGPHQQFPVWNQSKYSQFLICLTTWKYHKCVNCPHTALCCSYSSGCSKVYFLEILNMFCMLQFVYAK